MDDHYPTEDYHPHHYSLRRTTQRIRHLIHPDGKNVHVAQSPAEAVELKKSLSNSESDSEDEDIRVCVHGDDDHISILREIHAHHVARRHELRHTHPEVFEEAESVILELVALSEELRHVSSRNVQFDASFSKYGYSAHIRTHGEGAHSSSVSLSSGRTGQQQAEDWHALKYMGEPMKPWRKPVLRQYFHQKLLWRAQEIEEVASYELFLDLVYVGIIAISGDSAAEEANGAALLRFCISFTMGWKIWIDATQLLNWFEQDDIVRRIYLLFTLTCLVGFTVNISEYDSTTYTPLVAFYLAARLGNAFYYFFTAIFVSFVRYPLLLIGAVSVLPAAFWIGSIYLQYSTTSGTVQALIWIALALDSFGMPILMSLRMLAMLGQKGKNCANKLFNYWPGNNIEHRIDRQGAFVTLVFGYSVVSLLYQSSSHVGINSFFGKAVLGLIQAFTLNTLYFEVDSFNLHIHAIRRASWSALLWMMLHLPLVLSYVISFSALSRIVLMNDSPGASLDDLAPASQLKSSSEIESGLRWFYTAGLGLGMLCLNGIAHSHSYRSVPLPEGSTFPHAFERRVRRQFRYLIGLAIIFLGFADSLNSLQLISVTTGLVAASAAYEIIGASITGCAKRLKRRGSVLSGSTLHSSRSSNKCPKASFNDWWQAMRAEMCGDRRCSYRAKCYETKRIIEARGNEKKDLEERAAEKRERMIAFEDAVKAAERQADIDAESRVDMDVEKETEVEEDVGSGIVIGKVKEESPHRPKWGRQTSGMAWF